MSTVVAFRNDGDYLFVAEDGGELAGRVGDSVGGGPQPDCCGAGLLTLEVDPNSTGVADALSTYVIVCRDNDDPAYVEAGLEGCGAKRRLTRKDPDLVVFP